MKKKLLYGLAGILGFAAIAFAAVNSGFPFASQQWAGYGSKRGVVQFVITAASNGASSDFLPGVTGVNSLGTSALRFLNAYITTLNVSGASTLTGNVTASGTLTANQANLSMQVSTAPLTSSTVICTSSGTIVWNSTDKQVCVSSGTNKTTFVSISTPTAACAH